MPVRVLSAVYLAAALVELVIFLWLAHLRDPLPELPVSVEPTGDLPVEPLLKALTARCARSGLEVRYEPEFVAWFEEQLAVAAVTPPQFVAWEVGPALLRSAAGPGEYSATLTDGGPVLVPRVPA
jgi:hypothetical protein